MELPRRSPFVIFLLELSYKLAIIASVVTEPLRSRIRNNVLRRTSVVSHTLDSTFNDPSPVLVLMVYRAKNVELVQAFLREVKPDGRWTRSRLHLLARRLAADPEPVSSTSTDSSTPDRLRRDPLWS